jgi:1,4-dihydroxy-2-naphthoyl-CoA hydrolase
MRPLENTLASFNTFVKNHYPAHLGIVITDIGIQTLTAEFKVQQFLLSPNGYLHAGSVVSLADTTAGFGCYANLPVQAIGFTTIELKSNHLGTALDGTVECVAKAVHLGRTTQVWDAMVTSRKSGKTIALFRCTQLVIYQQ